MCNEISDVKFWCGNSLPMSQTMSSSELLSDNAESASCVKSKKIEAKNEK